MLRLPGVQIGQALNRSHPGNAGLVSWWLGLPGRMGGLRFHDIAGPNTGVLTNGAAWQGGAVSFDGSDDYVSCGVQRLPAIEAAKSVEVVCQYDGTTGRRILFSLVKDDTLSAGNSVNLEINNVSSTPVLSASAWGSGKRAYGFINHINANTFFHGIYTTAAGFSGGKVYVNGLDVTAGTATSSQAGSVGVCRIGSFSAAFPSPYANRPISSVAVFDRELPASVVAQRFCLWRQGWGQLLSRRRAYWDVPQSAGGGGFQSAWASQANGVLQYA